ncbi:MAG: UDP-glucose dehydrogenase family protein [Chloroflexota bacterium]
MRQITVIGTGYVGLTTGACFADMGNSVICMDVNTEKIAGLQEGLIPIFEPGLSEVVLRAMSRGRLRFTTDYDDALRHAEFVFIAVGTPDDGSGGADLDQVRSAAQHIAEHLDHQVIVVNKSTVPIGTGDLVSSIINEHRRFSVPFSVVSNPEFLREGSALADCLHPERVVLGSSNRAAADLVAELYSSLNAPIINTDLRTAEMIKYASNAFLATRISFINEIAAICQQLGADVTEVARGMGYDRRIGPEFLNAGLGFGGSCFPKDVKALMRMGEDAGAHPQLLEAVMRINQDRRRWVVDELRTRLGTLDGKRIALLGLAFKPDTDDMREAPSLDIIAMLQEEGAECSAYDPEARETAAGLLQNVALAMDAYSAVDGAHAVVLVTDWNEFKGLDLALVKEAMAGTLVVDGRNLFEPSDIQRHGLEYVGVARGEAARGGEAVVLSTLERPASARD